MPLTPRAILGVIGQERPYDRQQIGSARCWSRRCRIQTWLRGGNARRRQRLIANARPESIGEVSSCSRREGIEERLPTCVAGELALGQPGWRHAKDGIAPESHQRIAG